MADVLQAEVAQRERELQRLKLKLSQTQKRALDAAIAHRNRAPARPGLIAAQKRASLEEEERRSREQRQREETQQRKRQSQLQAEREAVRAAEAAAEEARLQAEQYATEQEAMALAMADHGDAFFDTMLQDLFVQYDLDANNVLDAEEFGRLLQSPTLGLAIYPGQEAQLMQALDRGGDGRINPAEFASGFRGLARRLYSQNDALDGSGADGDAAAWAVVYEHAGIRVQHCKATGEIRVGIPARKQAPADHRVVYEPPRDDFGRIALSAFLVVDSGGVGILSKAQMESVLRSPDLNLQLSDAAIATMVAEVPKKGIMFGSFLSIMRRCLAFVYLSAATPLDHEW